MKCFGKLRRTKFSEDHRGLSTVEIDTGAMLMKNTRWMRGFWAEAQEAFWTLRDVSRVDEVTLGLLIRLLGYT